MFFMKVSNVVTSCFIKLNRFLTISKGRIIYRAGDEKDSFYILIGGKVKLVNSDLGFKKICVPGETIGEEIVFIEQKQIKRVY
jgi:CRP-like cAMP-binding protein